MNLVVLFSFSFVVALFVLLGVIVGAFVVYRTKREGHEPFFNAYSPQGDAGQVEGYFSHEDGDDEPPMGGNVDSILYGDSKRRERLLEHMRQKDEETSHARDKDQV